jgi:chloramphenicol 3-O phosphotransferase
MVTETQSKSENRIGNVIFLNGPSSSGKTTLAETLQLKLTEPFMHIGIDRIIYMMPPNINNWEGKQVEQGFWWLKDADQEGKTVYHLQAGPYARKSMETLKDIVLTLANNGHHVIVDEVSFGKEGVEVWRKKLNKLATLFVGVHTPLSILELREKIRGDRIVGSARAQYQTVHNNVKYDLEVNTHDQTLEECAQKVMKAYYQQSTLHQQI